MAQVGVNTNTPEQALDVNGKVKVGDDGITPTDGTIRYNDADGAFEGYSNGEWQTLNAKPAAPENPIPITLSMFSTPTYTGVGSPPTSAYLTIDHVDYHYNFSVLLDLNDDNDRRVVPSGYFLVIDHLAVTGVDMSSEEPFLAEFIAADEGPAFLDLPRVMLSGTAQGGTAKLGEGRAPIMVLGEGQQLVFVNRSDRFVGPNVRAYATGFLVRNVEDYFTY